MAFIWIAFAQNYLFNDIDKITHASSITVLPSEGSQVIDDGAILAVEYPERCISFTPLKPI